MTNEQEIALRNFEALVRQLMNAYEQMRFANAELQQKLSKCQEELADAQETIDQLKNDYSVLKTARMIEVNGDDVKEAHARIAKLIREVDKCIALLDV